MHHTDKIMVMMINTTIVVPMPAKAIMCRKSNPISGAKTHRTFSEKKTITFRLQVVKKFSNFLSAKNVKSINIDKMKISYMKKKVVCDRNFL